MRECLRLAVAEAVGITGLIVWCRHVEQLPRSRDILGAPAVGEETEVPDAVETVGQDVDQKAADELVDGERHRLGPLTPAGAARDRRRSGNWAIDAGSLARPEPFRSRLHKPGAVRKNGRRMTQCVSTKTG